MKRNIYSSISSFGPTAQSQINNPLTYCLNDNIDQKFLHGTNPSITGQDSKPCQAFLADYCAEHWDGFCEIASKNNNISFPNNISGSTEGHVGMTSGDILIKNTASRKYMIGMGNCVQKFEPFDPTVPNSPIISYWIPNDGNYTGNCTPIYAVDPNTIDNDIVMDKILSKPSIAIEILGNIYTTMKRNNTLNNLKNTKLGKFFSENIKYFENKLYLR